MPPAPDEELPDMVRFQAMRDFTQLSDDTPLDFIPLRADGEEHRNVLAAAISNELLSEIRATCYAGRARPAASGAAAGCRGVALAAA